MGDMFCSAIAATTLYTLKVQRCAGADLTTAPFLRFDRPAVVSIGGRNVAMPAGIIITVAVQPRPSTTSVLVARDSDGLVALTEAPAAVHNLVILSKYPQPAVTHARAIGPLTRALPRHASLAR